jgi:hypothetical protein
MTSVASLSPQSPQLIAQIPNATINFDDLPISTKGALDKNPGWTPVQAGSNVKVRFVSSGVYEADDGKHRVRIPANTFAEAAKKAPNLLASKAKTVRSPAAPRSASPITPITPITNGSSWSDVRPNPKAQVQIPKQPSLPGTPPGQPQNTPIATKAPSAPRPGDKPTTQGKATLRPLTTPELLPKSALSPPVQRQNPLKLGDVDPASPSSQVTPPISLKLPATGSVAGPLEAKLKQQTEAMAQKAGLVSVKNMMTVPEVSPLKNPKSADLWREMNQSAFASSGGVYGVSTTGQSGSKGSLVNLYGAVNLVPRTKALDSAGAGAYALLGACAGWNLNGISRMTLPQRIAQVPLGIARDAVMVGVNQQGSGDNVVLDAGLKGTAAFSVTVLTNALAEKAGQILAPGKKSWGPDVPIRNGMMAASFTVTGSLTALNEAEKMGWLGGKLPERATWMQRLSDDIKQGAAIGTGVVIALGPAIAKATGGNKTQIALGFVVPFVQRVIAGQAINGRSDDPTANSAPSNSNSGSPNVKRMNLTDALRNGANPFALADSNRTAGGKYQSSGDPALKIASAVLELQDDTRPTTATPNVRTNDEAAAAIQNAMSRNRAGTLAAPTKKLLSNLLSDLKESGIYFGSTAVKAAAQASPSSSSAAVLDAEKLAHVRQVFNGSFRKSNGHMTKTDLVSTAIDLVLGGGSLLVPKLAPPATAAAIILDDAGKISDGKPNETTIPGFAERIRAKYGNVYRALGEKPPSGRNLTAKQRDTVESLLMLSMFRAVRNTVLSREGSSSQHGTDNAPESARANGGYYFTAYERMTKDEKEAVRTDLWDILRPGQIRRAPDGGKGREIKFTEL